MRPTTIAAPFAAAALALAACGNESSSFTSTDAGSDAGFECPRCGEVTFGESEITREHRVDLVFEAAIEIDRSISYAEGELRQALIRLGAAYGVALESSTPLSEMVAAVSAAVQADLATNVEGSVLVSAEPARCFADADAAQHAVRSCEEAAACGVVDVELSDTSFACAGACVGTCVGDVSGTCTREIQGMCGGTCTGRCVCDAPAACAGTCVGTCAGECPGSLSTSICVGSCAGDCTGVCVLPFGGACGGICDGLCAEETSGDCAGVADGECSGSCIGDCDGIATAPPDVTSACDASLGCQSAAALVSVARPRCAGAQIEIAYAAVPALTPEQLADLAARMTALERELGGVARAAALAAFATEAGADGAIGAIASGLEGLETSGEAYAIEECLVPCLIPAVADATDLVSQASNRASSVGSAAAGALAVIGLE
jgi:hypothetical protein